MTTVSDIVGDESDEYLVCKFFTQDLNEAILDKLKRMDKIEFSTQVHHHVKCDICGMIEPSPWFEQPMNETIREYARQYVSPPKMFYPNMEEALRVWGYYEENYNG